jgi:hypothetical protein
MMVGRTAIGHEAGWREYWPAEVRKCIELRRGREREDATSLELVRLRCERERNREQTAALKHLIHGRWYELEAERRGVRIPTTRAGARDASAHAGVRPAQLVDVARINLLRSQLAPGLDRIPTSYPQAEIERYFEAHRSRYVTRAQYLVEALIAAERRQADRMARLLEQRSARELVRRFGTEGVRAAFPGYYLDTVAIPNQRVAEAAPQMQRGDVAIVKDPRGWYVFRLYVAAPSRAPTLEAARSNVVQDLQARSIRRTYDAYDATLRAKYRDDTMCADGYEVDECS